MNGQMEVSVLSHLTNSAVVVYFIQWLRGTTRYRQAAAWLPIADGKVHFLVSALGALASGVGMHWAVDGNVSAGWHLALTIPPLWVIFHATWDWVQQLALNQLTFALAVQRKAAVPVATQQLTRDVSVTVPVDVKEHLQP